MTNTYNNTAKYTYAGVNNFRNIRKIGHIGSILSRDHRSAYSDQLASEFNNTQNVTRSKARQRTLNVSSCGNTDMTSQHKQIRTSYSVIHRIAQYNRIYQQHRQIFFKTNQPTTSSLSCRLLKDGLPAPSATPG